MSAAIVRICPSCGRANRVLYSRLNAEAHCGACKTVLPPPTEPIEVDDSTVLGDLLRTSSLPVLIDFWAPWCGPCRTMGPEIAKVAGRNPGRLLVVKVNTDVDPVVGATYRIQSIPTIAVFIAGVEVQRAVGARGASAVEALVRDAVAATAA